MEHSRRFQRNPKNRRIIEEIMQQIIVSGVGGQGVLFITKLLADTALDMGLSVLVSETHGMAQRGGNVISHLKVAGRAKKGESEKTTFTSPLVRPGRADVLLGLHPDSPGAHGFYLKTGGLSFCNLPGASGQDGLDASGVASELGMPIAANLVLLGFAAGSGKLFCSTGMLEATIEKLGGKRQEGSLKALRAGIARAQNRH
jgi:indolepyruvate ferredoxin oxidoreductase beta subunit